MIVPIDPLLATGALSACGNWTTLIEVGTRVVVVVSVVVSVGVAVVVSVSGSEVIVVSTVVAVVSMTLGATNTPPTSTLTLSSSTADTTDSSRDAGPMIVVTTLPCDTVMDSMRVVSTPPARRASSTLWMNRSRASGVPATCS